jgi:hypothetical protein
MHTGRFAVFYRQTYGHSPHHAARLTLLVQLRGGAGLAK